ncbi:hypothetical protein F2Q70_00021976 [Brassica cretica]|uniref:Uncharacterized protein n=2 Tax=Brassica cretica TaxID=69181 RepID=A0A8S9GHS3_BRACR|nr:hypothetical protein F2Q70_00021976 [Brassica cretica]KAF2558704.1 hypothetical protein F2Q68_00015756 [Brassica cretica]KAF3611368.1 hypothetical protein DY000_02048334 [Brassica cretica]
MLSFSDVALVLAGTPSQNDSQLQMRHGKNILSIREFPAEVDTQQSAGTTNQVVQEERLGTQEKDRENANTWTYLDKTMAEDMWRDATS